MINDKFKTELRNKRLHIFDMFEGNIVVEEMDKQRSYEYLIGLASKFMQAAINAMKEAEKYGGAE